MEKNAGLQRGKIMRSKNKRNAVIRNIRKEVPLPPPLQKRKKKKSSLPLVWRTLNPALSLHRVTQAERCVQETWNKIRRTRKKGIMTGRSNCRPLLIRNMLKSGGWRSKTEEKRSLVNWLCMAQAAGRLQYYMLGSHHSVYIPYIYLMTILIRDI